MTARPALFLSLSLVAYVFDAMTHARPATQEILLSASLAKDLILLWRTTEIASCVKIPDASSVILLTSLSVKFARKA